MEINYVIEANREEFESGNVRNELFLMMTKFGVRDYSETVHTLGLNYVTAIGRTIEGISAISECPVYPYGKILCESVVVYWSYPAVTAWDISDTISILDKGFYLPNKKYVAGINSRKTKYLVYHCIAKGTKENLTLNQWIKVR